MLAVFEKSIGNRPEDLSLPLKGKMSLPGGSKTGEEIVEIFRSWRSDSTLQSLPNGSSPTWFCHMRMNVLCIHENMCELRRHYGLSRQATEAMVVVEAYSVLRDRAPYTPDQVIRDLQGRFAFVLFDSKVVTLLLARFWSSTLLPIVVGSGRRCPASMAAAGDGSLVYSDDLRVIAKVRGKCYTPFPPGCIFMNTIGLISFDHPLNKVRPIAREDEVGNICGVIFQVDLFTRLRSIPRSGSAANWAGATAVEGD